MKCKNCGVKISDLEIYCDECKEILKQEKENREFKKLAIENKKLNELEATIEIDVLETLDKKIEEEQKEIVENKEKNEDTKEIIEIKEEIIEKPDNKKKIIIICSIVLLVLIILGVSLILIFSKEKEEVIEIDYKKVITEYGDSVKVALDNYLKENEEVPPFSKIKKLIKYDKYKVVCKTNNIYEDGNIYLNNCKIDNKKIKYSYGKEQEVIKEGKQISIYKINSNNNYSNEQTNNSTLISTITCKTDNCNYIMAYDKYVLINEDNKYYLYDYETNSIEFGPFDMDTNAYENNILSYNNKLYGIIYKEETVNNIYSVESKKELEDIKGFLFTKEEGFDPTIMYKYGYAIFSYNGISNFINLKTGNVSYSIDGIINSFIEDTSNNITYIITYNSQNKKITIYNSNGKKLFNGKEFNDMKLLNNNIIVSDDNKYYIYDTSLKLKLTSKKYNNILGLYDDFIVVVDNNYLEIVNLEDKILATFELEWDNNQYIFHNNLSGWKTENNKKGIYLIIEDRIKLNGTKGKGLKYYYIPNTKEIGVIELSKIN